MSLCQGSPDAAICRTADESPPGHGHPRPHGQGPERSCPHRGPSLRRFQGHCPLPALATPLLTPANHEPRPAPLAGASGRFSSLPSQAEARPLGEDKAGCRCLHTLSIKLRTLRPSVPGQTHRERASNYIRSAFLHQRGDLTSLTCSRGRRHGSFSNSGLNPHAWKKLTCSASYTLLSSAG